MQSTQVVINFTIVLILVFFHLGCASFASNPAACREAAPLVPFPNTFAGNIFQFSPCTSIEPLRIETGEELDYIRSGITRALDSNQLNEYVGTFAYKMGCNYKSHDEFFKELMQNRYDIFGKEVLSSNRQAVIAVRKITKTNPILKEACWE